MDDANKKENKFAHLSPEQAEKAEKAVIKLEAVKAVDLARLTEEAWSTEREKMIKICKRCRAEKYAREQLSMGDSMMQKADRLMAEAIETVAALYKDGIIKKPEDYPFAYPDFLFFMQTGGSDVNNASYIDQVLLQISSPLESNLATYE